MIKTYRFRLFTNANQERELASTLETHRRLYNQLLDGKILCWETAGVTWTFAEQSRWFTIQKTFNAYYAKLNRGAAQETIRRLDKAFRHFFADKKASFPRFQGRDRFNSICYSISGHGRGCKVVAGKLRIQNIGTIRVCWHRELPPNADIRTVTIKRYCGKWYACFAVDIPKTAPVCVPPASVGIDLGLHYFVTTSDGDSLGDSKTMKVRLAELRRRQRALARCKKGSSSRKIAKFAVTKLHATVANSRRDMHHKVAHQLVKNYGTIAVESLNVQGLLKNHRLARSIADAGWSQFVSILTHKAEWAGVKVQLVDPKYTSQDCSQCGNRVRKSLAVRIHRCACGCVLDRDHNAAINILARTEPRFANVGNSLLEPKASK